MVDLANTRAQLRRDRGLCQVIRMIQTNQSPYPSLGGTCGFTVWVMMNALEIFDDMESYKFVVDSIGFSSVSVWR